MCGSFPGLLIGRTAVHSGKDPAFVAYDQFLSTNILQPLSRVEVRCGSDSVIWRCLINVRITPTSGPQRLIMACRMSAISGCEQSQQSSLSYSITSSARASSVGGTSRPSDLAVLRFPSDY